MLDPFILSIKRLAASITCRVRTKELLSPVNALEMTFLVGLSRESLVTTRVRAKRTGKISYNSYWDLCILYPSAPPVP